MTGGHAHGSHQSFAASFAAGNFRPNRLPGYPLFFLGRAQSVTTQHYDNNRTGINPRESVLTTGNVGSGIFGKLFTRPVDGHIYAQPLYVPKVFEIFDHTATRFIKEETLGDKLVCI